jgi:hypothetical protein
MVVWPLVLSCVVCVDMCCVCGCVLVHALQESIKSARAKTLIDKGKTIIDS